MTFPNKKAYEVVIYKYITIHTHIYISCIYIYIYVTYVSMCCGSLMTNYIYIYYIYIRAYSRNLGKRLILARKRTFL